MSEGDGKADLLGMLPEELETFLRALGQPAYRARQLFAWLHRGAAFEEMTDLPAPLRERLAALASAARLRPVERVDAPDGATKFGFRTTDGHTIETVLIPQGQRRTVCVSSQVGCAFRCAFCATGRQGLTRSLSAGEIAAQVVLVQKAVLPARVSNVVFMGMGEPLANLEAVMKAVRLLNHPYGLAIGARHIAISTCGLPEQIVRLGKAKSQVALAISLHAATDEVRAGLVPISRKHPLRELMGAVRRYVRETGRKVSFEWVVVPGVNDTPEQARLAAELLRRLPSMVNVIPRNPIDQEGAADPGPAYRFAALLSRHGVEAVVRRSRGAEVLGACGQLRAREEGAEEVTRERSEGATRERSRPARSKPRR
jgi:23S rRNA (adenine2503-C2)-methyltransferase